MVADVVDLQDHERADKRTSPRVVVGTTGLDFQSGQVNEEWLRQLAGKRGVRVFREMADNDATTGGSLHIVKWIVRQAAWTVEPNRTGGAASDDAARFVDECMQDMDHTWTSYVTEVLSMLTFGWASMMPIYKVRGGLATDDPSRHSAFDDNRIGWRALAVRAQESLDAWEFDDEGNVLGWWQTAAPHYRRVFLPMDRLIHFRIDEHKNNPEGTSLLRAAYRSWFFLKRLQEIEAIGIERDLVGLPVFEVPQSMFAPAPPQAPGAPPQTDPRVALRNYQAVVGQLRRNEKEGLVIPAEIEKGLETGYRLRLLSTGGSRQIDTSKPIERYSRDIAQTFLTQFQFLGMSSAGTQALSGNLIDVFSLAVTSILDIIEETQHRFGTIPLLRLNGIPAEAWPRIRHGQVSKQNLESLSKAMLNLTNAGLLTPTRKTEQFLRSESGLPELDDDEESVGDADLAQQRADAAALRNGPPGGQPQQGGAPSSGSTGGATDGADIGA
jgi:hypothetical protein